MNHNAIAQQLIRHEGLKLSPYRCPAGYLTIGVGRNLETKGINKAEALILLKNDIDECEADLKTIFPDWDEIPEQLQHVLIDMRFNLGPRGFRSFRLVIQGVRDRDQEAVITQMAASKWARQVPNRASNLMGAVRSSAPAWWR